MKTNSVVLWGQDDLLSAAIEHLISSRPGWRVINVPADQPLTYLKEILEGLTPSILIAQQPDGPDCSEMPTMLLDALPGLKVILLSLNSNVIEVYSRERVLVESSGDLIDVIGSNLAEVPTEESCSRIVKPHDETPVETDLEAEEHAEAITQRSLHDG